MEAAEVDRSILEFLSMDSFCSVSAGAGRILALWLGPFTSSDLLETLKGT